MKKTIIIILLILSCTQLIAQKSEWDSVLKDKDNYCFGIGEGEKEENAYNAALADLLSSISVVISSQYQASFDESSTNDKSEQSLYVKNKISTFSSARINGIKKEILRDKPGKWKVGVWLENNQIDKIFENRIKNIKEYVRLAESAEERKKVDDALRYYYWAYSLLKTIRNPIDVEYTDGKGKERVLQTWIPDKLNEIFGDISVSFGPLEKNDLITYFKFRGGPASSLDFSYNDGRGWSNICSAKDGTGVIELNPEVLPSNIFIRFEFKYLGQASMDTEVEAVLKVVKTFKWKKSEVMVPLAIEAKEKPEKKSEDKAVSLSKGEEVIKDTGDKAIFQLSGAESADYLSILNNIANGIRTGQYSGCYKYFTPSGRDMFDKLLKYGKAKLVGDQMPSLYRHNNCIYARSLKMSFSFSRGVRKNFVEDVVFTFTPEKKIDCLAFGLDKDATEDILTKGKWPDAARLSILEFLENYKTAFALKRLDYIESIFDNNAIIIVGHVTKKHNYVSGDGKQIATSDNPVVTKTRYEKKAYIERLARAFKSNEFINIRFANNNVRRAGLHGEFGERYGIQIKQDYYSSNYADKGYLFLLVDLNDPDKPVIYIRTWQEEPDMPKVPGDNGLIGLYSF